MKNDFIKTYVIEKLKGGYIPKQIAGKIRIDYPYVKINHKSIYLYIYHEAPELVHYLVRRRRNRHKRSIKPGKRMVKILNRVMISQRPNSHEKIHTPLGVDTYFCHAYHSWEKGGIEHSIGFIRRFFPKKTDFELITQAQVAKVESLLNNRPRKTLKFKTLNEEYINCT